jgi:hypothetical protein
MLVAGASLLAVRQLLLALSSAPPPAVLGRVLVAVGNAIVFVAVPALVPRPAGADGHSAGRPGSDRLRPPARWWRCSRWSWCATPRTARPIGRTPCPPARSGGGFSDDLSARPDRALSTA